MTGATMRTLLRVLLAVLGVSAVLIALSILTLGAGATAAAGERVFDALSGWRGPDSPPWPPTMDNELRFYAALWGAYGVVLLLAARDYTGWAGRVPWLAAVFFVGGAGRAFSWLMIGAPHGGARAGLGVSMGASLRRNLCRRASFRCEGG